MEKKTFVIYTTGTCPYCTLAKSLVIKLGHEYEEKRVDLDPALFDEMKTRSENRKTVPQIFVGDYHIGGYDNFKSLHDQGNLEMILDMAG